MATSSSTRQTSPTNIQLQFFVRDISRIGIPELVAQSSPGSARSNRELMIRRSLSFHERGRFRCLQTPLFEPAAAGKYLLNRRHSMPPVLDDDIFTEIEGGDKLLSYPCGESSQRYNASALLSPDMTSFHVYDRMSDHDSTISSEALCPHIVLNITPSLEGMRTGTSISIGSTEVELVQHPPPSLDSRRTSISLNIREDESLPHDRSRLTEISLGITAQVALAILTLPSCGKNATSSNNNKILLHSAAACNITGFLCCIIDMLVGGHRPSGVTAKIIRAVGYIATMYGFVALMGTKWDDHLKLWITGATAVALIPLLLVFLYCRKIKSTPGT